MYLKLLVTLILLTVKTAFLEKVDSEESLEKKDVHEALHQFADHLNGTLQLMNQQLSEIRNLLGKSPPKPPKHCREVQERGHTTSGVYQLQPEFSPEPFLAWCDMETEDGGWTYFLNRFDGSQDFYRDWEDYRNGFGNLAGEFWLGLTHLHALTGFDVNELLIELEDWDSKRVSARYDSFSIGGESEGYGLKMLGRYSGDAGDSFTYHSGMKFTTKDKDQDRYNGGNCGTYRGGGWWYKNCVNSHLTGKYMKREVDGQHEFKIMYWEKFHGFNYSLKKARMMVRPVKNSSGVTDEENSN